jgi:hypothetical protein
LAIPITIQQENKGKHYEVIVITQGAEQDSVTAFQKNKNIPVLSEDDFLDDPSVAYDSVHVFGFGLSTDELKLMDQHFIFHQSSIKSGITFANWNRKSKRGEELLVQGTYTNHRLYPVTLFLTGFNTVMDSFLVPANQSEAFELKTVPKQNGKAVYDIIALRGKDTLEKEPVPIEVVTSSPVKVMILSASPDFENRFLKDWLSQNGYTVVNKTMISASKYDQSFFNSRGVTLDKITPSTLSSFDIVLSDEASLSSLNKTEQENIYREVSNKGLGLIIRGDTITDAKNWFTKSFRLYKPRGEQSSKITVSFPDDPHFKAILTAEESMFIRLHAGMQPLVTDSAGNIIIANTAEGAGKIIFTTLNNTYTWLLSGNNSQYYNFWNRLLQKAAKLHEASSLVETMPALPVNGLPVHFVVNAKQDTVPVIRIDDAFPAFIQHPKRPNQWETVYWPSHSGWQRPVILANDEYNWYVFDKNDWPYISARERIEAGEHYGGQTNLKNRPNAVKTAAVPLSLVYFFLPFIICCAFLWAERKIS